MDQFWFHFGTFESSFTVSDYSRINSLVMKFSPSYYCSQIIVLRHDIWMTFSSQVTEQSIHFVTITHKASYFLICHEMLTVSESELNCFRSAALWQRWGALWALTPEGGGPGLGVTSDQGSVRGWCNTGLVPDQGPHPALPHHIIITDKFYRESREYSDQDTHKWWGIWQGRLLFTSRDYHILYTLQLWPRAPGISLTTE